MTDRVADDPDSEIFIEMQRVGNAVEVRAISGRDGFEVSFVAPADGPRAEVERVARAKLAYARRRKEAESQEGGGGQDGGDGRRAKGGLLA